MRHFDIVVAVDKNGGIGKGGGLPWNLPGDMSFFKRVTSEVKDSSKQNAIVMGRKTWESIPLKFRPLKNRLNIVISRSEKLELPPGVLLAKDLDTALQMADRPEIERVFVIGGGAIYDCAVPHPMCDTIYLTRVHDTFGCDTFFPPMGERFKQAEDAEAATHEDNGIRYQFQQYKNQQ